LDPAYEACLEYELNEKKLKVERQKTIPLIYRGVQLDCGYRLDFLVEDKVVVEVKAVDKLEPIHEAQ
jgi:GxxExxY protein